MAGELGLFLESAMKKLNLQIKYIEENSCVQIFDTIYNKEAKNFFHKIELNIYQIYLVVQYT